MGYTTMFLTQTPYILTLICYMIIMKKANIITPIAILAVTTSWLFINSTEPAPSNSPAPQSTPHVTNLPPMPKSLSFCGEKVPLDRSDVWEALDREILTNTFWHTNTQLVIKRSGRFFPIIEPILKEEGIPEDFKYLCVAESNLIPTAKSPAGAVGLWQILEGTGRELNLEVNKDIDERYNIVKSTHAACQYLKKAYSSLGSWTLVAAAYNGGQGRVMRNMANQKQNSFYDILWAEETARYPFRIMALKLIMENPSDYGFNIGKNDLYKPYDTYTVAVDTTINDLAQFAIDNNTTYKMLKVLNPWMRQNIMPNKSRRNYVITLPKREK